MLTCKCVYLCVYMLRYVETFLSTGPRNSVPLFQYSRSCDGTINDFGERLLDSVHVLTCSFLMGANKETKKDILLTSQHMDVAL